VLVLPPLTRDEPLLLRDDRVRDELDDRELDDRELPLR